MRNYEHIPKQVTDAISGDEVRALINHGITPLFLRGSGPTNNAEREHELMALSYGYRRVEGQGGMVIGDGLSHGSPIMLGEYARRNLEQSRRTLWHARKYREIVQLQEDQLLAQAQITYPDAELPPVYGPELPPPGHAQPIDQHHELH